MNGWKNSNVLSPLLYVNNLIIYFLSNIFPDPYGKWSNYTLQGYQTDCHEYANVRKSSSRVATEEWIIIKREKQALQAQYIF